MDGYRKILIMNKNLNILCLLVFCFLGCNNQKNKLKENAPGQHPNIIVFYVDDLGYGDLSCYGATQVNTPNVDKLAKGGIRFTDAHSSAATCTPSRYSLLTGEYAFRKKAEILPGDAPLLISPDALTLPGMLQKAGYSTAVVGKWHLGLGLGNVDWNKEVKPGPLEVGFGYSFLLPATGDRVPTVYLENYYVNDLRASDTIRVSYKEDLGQIKASKENARYISDKQHSQTLINGVGRIGAMTGGESALWKDEDFPDVFTSKAIDFIEEHQENPFFLFFSFHDIHVPRLPNERFQGKTSMGPRGDAIVQMDWMTGRIVETLQKLEIKENTLIVFTSDNGPVLNDGYEDLSVENLGNHKPSGPFRGNKYSAYEAGTRVPAIVYWPDKITPKTSNALLSQVDLFKSLSKLTGVPLQDDEAIDSEDHLDAWLGQSSKGRTYLLEESAGFSLRWGDWKYIEPVKHSDIPEFIEGKGIESGLDTIPQLYNLHKDIFEIDNLAKINTEIAERLQQKLNQIKQ